MTWILIVILIGGGSSTPVAYGSTDFSSHQACETAAGKIKESLADNGLEIKLFCTEK